jgi:hypothetical protein
LPKNQRDPTLEKEIITVRIKVSKTPLKSHKHICKASSSTVLNLQPINTWRVKRFIASLQILQVSVLSSIDKGFEEKRKEKKRKCYLAT